MFEIAETKTFGLCDLTGRTLEIRSFKGTYTILTIAKDIKTGEMFVLEELKHTQCK